MSVPPAVEQGPSRLDALRAMLLSRKLDGLIVSKRENVRYLSGFTGSSSALRITADDATLVTDSRYGEQAAQESPGFEIEIVGGHPTAIAASRTTAHRLGCEAESISHEQWGRLTSLVEDKGGRVLVPCTGLVESLRIRKSAQELVRIERAIAIASAAFERIRMRIEPGIAEKELALELEFDMRRNGAEDVAFDLIVASGPRSAMPHGRASDRRLGVAEFVVFDIGARFEGYHSDMTRTLFTGAPGDKQRFVHDTVLEANRRGIEAIRPGISAGEVDRAARSVIERAGLGERFGHGTGHGVGLEVHEAPRLGASSIDELEPGMVVTVEPGVYLPGEGGVRIEDMVLVEETGARVLTTLPTSSWIVE